jgi:hypothetical protein
MRKFGLGILVLVVLLIVFLIGVAVGFRMPTEDVNYTLVRYSATPGSIWDTTGFGGPLYKERYLSVIVRDLTPSKKRDPRVAQIFSSLLKENLLKRGFKIIEAYPTTLLVEIKNFSTRRLLGLGIYSIKKSAEEIANNI